MFILNQLSILHHVPSNLLISRAIIPQAITLSGGWGKRGWGTGTSIYPARLSAQESLSFAMILRERQSLNRRECERK